MIKQLLIKQELDIKTGLFYYSFFKVENKLLNDILEFEDEKL